MCHCNVPLPQGLIHPMIARMAWVVGVESPLSLSPFRYCNGTPRATVLTAHTDDSFLGDLNFPSLLYIDFAGSGTVHLLGMMPHAECKMYCLLLFSFAMFLLLTRNICMTN